MAKKNIEAVLNICDTEFPNNGVAYLDDKKILVKNTIPEQKVKVYIKKRRRKYEGKIIEIQQKAPYEINSQCDVFGVCGGCTFQNIDYSKEAEFKLKNIKKLLKNANINYNSNLEIIKSPVTDCYRNKMEFSFGDDGLNGSLCLGMRKRDSFYEVSNADKCLIVDNDIRDILSCVLEFFKNTDETFYHKMKKTGNLRNLIVRRANFTKEILINLVTKDYITSDLNNLVKKILSLNLSGKISGILNTINSSPSDAVYCDKLNILYGNDYFFENLFGLKFKISAFSFFQTNSIGAEILYSVIKDFSGDCSDKVIFDLYCGTGTIAQIMSNGAKKVIGIELIDEAVKAAEENAKLNNISNCEFISGDVLKVIDEINITPDIIILDPPREGIHPKAINKIIEFGAKKIIYVSCKPTSMTRDLNIFIENSYTIKNIKCVDMFPRSAICC